MLVSYSYRYAASKMHDEKKKRTTWKRSIISIDQLTFILIRMTKSKQRKQCEKAPNIIILRISFHSIVNICIIVELRFAITIAIVEIEFHPKTKI